MIHPVLLGFVAQAQKSLPSTLLEPSTHSSISHLSPQETPSLPGDSFHKPQSLHLENGIHRKMHRRPKGLGTRILETVDYDQCHMHKEVKAC